MMGSSQQRRGEVLSITSALAGGNLWKSVNMGDTHRLTHETWFCWSARPYWGELATDVAGWQCSRACGLYSLWEKRLQLLGSLSSPIHQPLQPGPQRAFLHPAQPAAPAGRAWREGNHRPAWQEVVRVELRQPAAALVQGPHGATAGAQAAWRRTRRVGSWLGFSLLLQHCSLQELPK